MANNNLNNNNELFLLSAEWLILVPLALYRFTFLGGDATSGLRCLLSEFGWECFSPRQSLQFVNIHN